MTVAMTPELFSGRVKMARTDLLSVIKKTKGLK